MGRIDRDHIGTVLDAVQSPRSAALSPIAASWCRSALHHGLDPANDHKAERIDQHALSALRQEQEDLLIVAGPILDRLFRQVGRSGCGVLLSDARGVILERRTGDGDSAGFDAVGLAPGGLWSEATEGTNGIGTCLFEDKPVIIHRNQHFATRNIGISCMDAPIHDPHGRLLAALDISSCRDDHTLPLADMIAMLVQETARTIERDLFCRHYDEARILFIADEPSGGTALLAVDRDDMVIGASRGARQRLRLDDRALAAPRPLADLLGDANGAAPSFHDGERAVLRRALAQAGGNASLAARRLGIGRATLYRRLKRTGLLN